jgi:hypothetical protein
LVELWFQCRSSNRRVAMVCSVLVREPACLPQLFWKAPEGRRTIAQGVSPGSSVPSNASPEPRQGRWSLHVITTLPPLWGLGQSKGANPVPRADALGYCPSLLPGLKSFCLRTGICCRLVQPNCAVASDEKYPISRHKGHNIRFTLQSRGFSSGNKPGPRKGTGSRAAAGTACPAGRAKCRSRRPRNSSS